MPKQVPVAALQFENALETALQTLLLQNGLNDPKKQRDYDLVFEDEAKKKKILTLKTPRIEVRCQFNGFLRQYYIAKQGTTNATPYQCRQRGQTMFRIITSRQISKADEHAKMRGAVRALMMMGNWISVSNLMPYHQMVEAIESGTTLTINQDEFQDVSAMGFETVIDIRSSVFEAP